MAVTFFTTILMKEKQLQNRITMNVILLFKNLHLCKRDASKCMQDNQKCCHIRHVCVIVLILLKSADTIII